LKTGEIMRGAVLYGPRDVRFEERDVPRIVNPTDVIIRITATCVCGSDLWPYRGIQPIAQPTPMGHEYCGVVEDMGSAVTTIKPGQFVIGSFFASDNTCPNCRVGYQSSCQHAEFIGTAQAPFLRVPLADGTLVAAPDVPSDDMVPSLLALSDVMGTGWFVADAANVKPGKTVVVVGDGAVGLLGVLSAKHMGAERIIAMSRHESRQKLAREFGATDIVTERGDEGVEQIKQLTNGIGADSVLECVGTQQSMMQAIQSTRRGGFVGYVGVPHGVELNGEQLFFAHIHLHGGPAPVRRYLPDLIKLVWDRKIDPGKVFDMTCLSTRWRKPTARWMSAARSRRCCVLETHHASLLTVLRSFAACRLKTYGLHSAMDQFAAERNAYSVRIGPLQPIDEFREITVRAWYTPRYTTAMSKTVLQ